MNFFDFDGLFDSVFSSLITNTGVPAKNNKRRSRTCRIEELESREMLSVTLSGADWDTIRANYADLELSASQSDYNIIVLEADVEADNEDFFDFDASGLQAAIDQAARTTANDIIVIRTSAEQNKITLDGTELAISINARISGSLTIVSLGDAPLTIDAKQQSRVKNISTSTVALAGLTITGGTAMGTNGGGICSSVSTLTITNCTISGNTALLGNGGGIYNTCKFSIAAHLTITNSTIEKNRAFLGRGGGVYNDTSYYSMSNIAFANCVIAGNDAIYGGGFYISTQYSTVANITFTNCVIAGNNATYSGAIHNETSNATANLTITNCTIVGNTASDSGISSSSRSVNLIINNSIVAKNTQFGTDIVFNLGTLQGSNNIIGNGTRQTSLINGTNNNIVGTASNPIDPGFVKIPAIDTNNTGMKYNSEHWDLRLLASSPAINAGNNALAVGAKGGPLFVDLDGKRRIANGTVDIGTYEYGSSPVFPPVTPENLRSTSNNETSVALAWDTVGTATSYEVRRRTGSGVWIILPVTGTSTTIGSLADDTPYLFQVRAVNADGYSAWSATLPVTTDRILVPPSVPANFKMAARTLDSITLVWDAQSGLSNYTLEYKLSTDTTWILWTPEPETDATTATITDLTENTKYDFRLTATNMDGFALATTTVSTAREGDVPIAVPTNLTEQKSTSTTLTISWTGDEDAEGYVIQWALAIEDFDIPDGAGLIGERYSDTASYEITGLTAETTYFVRVMATTTADGCQNSEWSLPESFTTKENIVTPILPGIPKNLKSTKTTDTITLSWDTVTDAMSYEIQWKKSSDASFELWTDSIITTPTAIFINLNPNTLYQFQVRAVNADGYSDWSAMLPITTDRIIAPPSVPANFCNTARTPNSITLAWDTQSGLTGYTLEYKLSTASTWTPWTPAPGAGATTATITGLTANTEYNFRLKATNIDGDSGYAETTVSTAKEDDIPIAVPTNLTEQGCTATTLTISWTGNVNAEGYVIQWALSVADFDIPDGAGLVGERYSVTASYEITGLAAETTYYVRVMATTTADGYQNSVWSVPSPFTTDEQIIPPTPPETPVNLGSTKTTTSITLTWNPVADATSYEIQWKKADDASFATWTGTTATATFAELTANTLYQFQVRAVNADGASDWSAVFPVTTNSASTTIGAPVISLAGSLVSWVAVSGAATYQVQVKVPGSANFVAVGSPITATSINLAGRWTEPGNYVVRVIAIGADSTESIASNTITWTIDTQLPTDYLTVTGGGNALAVTWITSQPVGSVLQFKQVGSSDWTEWRGATSGSSLTIPGLKVGTYEVRLVNKQGEVLDSETGIIVTANTATAAVPQKPKVKADKKISKPTISSVTLIITPHKKATSESNVRYVIDLVQVGKSKGRPTGFTPITVTASYLAQNGNKILIEGLAPGMSYKFAIKAVNANGETLNGKKKPKEVVSNVTAKTAKYTAVKKLKSDKNALSDSSVTLTWIPSSANLPTGADVTTSYKIVWLDGGVEKSKIVSSAIASITGLTAKTKYKFTVQEIATVDGEDIFSLGAAVSVKTR